MNIFSWNVNGVRAATRKGMLEWMSYQSPDILCLQETKCQESDLEANIMAPFGYKSIWCSAEKRGYSGVALYSKAPPEKVTFGLGVKEFDSEGRTLIAQFPKFTLINCYFPNSRHDHSRLSYKLDYCDAIMKYCAKMTKQKKPFVLCGDINVAHKEIDLKNPKTNQDNPGFLPEERAWMDRFLGAAGEPIAIDTFREFCKEPGHYSWWSQRPGVREKNVGWRIDYHFVNPILRPKLKSATIWPDVLGSDHCPVSIELE